MHCPHDMKPQPFHNGRAVSRVDLPEMLTGCKKHSYDLYLYKNNIKKWFLIKFTDTVYKKSPLYDIA